VKSDRRPRAAWAGLIAGLGLLTAVLYGPALRLPFFFDDFAHIPFVDAHNLAEIWQTAHGLAYYRPLAFTLWKLLYLLLGHHDAVAQHTVNLVVHWGNGLMVAWLAAHLWRSPGGSIDWRRAWLSATLFLLYPFSYQAVPWVGSLAHPLVTALILLSLIGYLKWRETGRGVWSAFGLTAALLSPFAHENGALVGPLIAIIELTRPWHAESIGRRLLRATAWTIPALVWLPIWWLAPKALSAGSLALNAGEALLQNSVYVVQGVAYPTTWLGGWLRADLGVNDLVAVLGLGLPALIGAALIQWRAGAPERRGAESKDRRAWLPWLWCALAALPAIVFLRFDYVINGPRLLVLVAVGAAWLWADVVIRMADLSRVGAALAVGACLVVLAQNFVFIRDRMAVHEMGGAVIRQATLATTTANEDGQAAIFINLPAWIAPARTVYALGHEGVQFLPGYVPPETLASVNAGRPARLSVIRFDATRQPMPYLFGLRGQPFDWPSLAQDGGRVFAARYQPDAITIEPVGELAASVLATEPVAQFNAAVVLLDATATVDDGRLQIDLTWQILELPSPDVTVFVHVLNADGQLVAQADGDPLSGTYPFGQWTPGLVVRDRRAIEVSGSGLSLRVGLYDRATGERLAAISDDGAPFADNAVPLAVRSAP
jgi:hypothetical protein